MKENTDTMVEETKPAPPARDSEDDSGSAAETENGWKRFERRNPRLRLGLLVGGIALLGLGFPLI